MKRIIWTGRSALGRNSDFNEKRDLSWKNGGSRECDPGTEMFVFVRCLHMET